MKTMLLMGVSSLALGFAAPALAQETPADTPAETADTTETIIVTAQLSEQRPVEVPFALSVFNTRSLEDLNIQDFEDLARFTPGFAVQNQSPNNPAISIRGITFDSGFSYFEPRVSIYQDGVSIAKPRGAEVGANESVGQWIHRGVMVRESAGG